jgi:hypothetical protein
MSAIAHSLMCKQPADALDDAEVRMPASQSDPNAEKEFTRKSETESICMRCYVTVRSQSATFLALAEDVHSQTCYGRRLEKRIGAHS